MHNYVTKWKALVESGTVAAPVGLSDLKIEHDDFRLIFVGGECNCDPQFTLTAGLSIGEHLQRIAESAANFRKFARSKRQ